MLFLTAHYYVVLFGINYIFETIYTQTIFVYIYISVGKIYMLYTKISLQFIYIPPACGSDHSKAGLIWSHGSNAPFRVYVV